jgi:putative nucleotidyltransferase with HDIG domain
LIDLKIRSALFVPIIHDTQLLGVLAVFGWQVDAFSMDDRQWLELFASQVAVALENTRLYEETRQRLNELEAVNRISTALRAAQTLDEMLPLLLDVTLQMLQTTAGSIWLFDPAKNEYHTAVTRGWGDQAQEPSLQISKPGEGLVAHVVASGQAYIAKEFRQDPHLSEPGRRMIPPGIGGAAVPVYAGDQVIGAFVVNVQLPRELSPGEVHLLTTLSAIAGNAIQRATLHEETQRRLVQVQGLNAIDRAIMGNVDIQATLDILLLHLQEQLRADAADILLLDPVTKILEYAAGRGFTSGLIEDTRLHVGEGLAGRAAAERRILHVPQMAGVEREIARPQLILKEGFVSFYGVPLVTQSKVKGVLEIFHRSEFTGDPEWMSLLDILATQATIAIDKAELFYNLERSNAELELAYDNTIEGWSRALDLRDRETEGHTQRVTEITLRLARQMGVPEAELIHVRRGALLHDIGKMGVPDQILLKPGPLTDAEWAIMRRHPTLAFELLSPIVYLRQALEIPFCHHEKWDGTGYPRGLKGEQIPLLARLFSIVDVWDALRSERPYRAAWPEEKVRAYLKEQADKHFDPQVVDAFLKLLDERA